MTPAPVASQISPTRSGRSLRLGRLVLDVDLLEHLPALELAAHDLPGQFQHLAGARLGVDDRAFDDLRLVLAGRDGIEVAVAGGDCLRIEFLSEFGHLCRFLLG
jgi:hypothetical protein